MTDSRGAEGKVTSILDSLHGEWVAFHNAQSSSRQPFHVLFSPIKGVFVILTNPVVGRVGLTENECNTLINGEPATGDPTQRCLEAVRLTQNAIGKKAGINIPIQGILAFPNAYVNVDAPVQGVILQNAMCIEDYLWRRQDIPEARLVWEHREAIENALGEPGSTVGRNRSVDHSQA